MIYDIDRKRMFSATEELFYLKSFKTGANVWRRTLSQGNLLDAVANIYTLLAHEVEQETKKEFGLIPQDIEKTLQEGIGMINTSMTALLSPNNNNINEQEIFLNALDKIKNIEPSKINTATQLAEALELAAKESEQLSNYLRADFFETNDINKILDSIKNTKNEQGVVVARGTASAKGAIRGHVSNMQGYFTEYLLTKSREAAENLVTNGVTIVEAIKAPKVKGKLVKADVIITFELNGVQVKMGISAKTYLSKSPSQIKLSEQMNLGNLTPDKRVQISVARICRIVFTNSTQQLAARKLIAAMYIDEGQGGSGQGRALMSFVVTRGQKQGTLNLSTEYLYNYFKAYANRASSGGAIPIAYLNGSLNFLKDKESGNNMLRNMTAIIKGPNINK